MVKRKQADGSMIEDDAPAPVTVAPPVAPPVEPPVEPPVDEATNNEDDKDKGTDKPETSAAEGKGGGTSAFEKEANEMIAAQLKLGSEFGEKVRNETGISKVTGAAEAVITTPLKAVVGVVQAAPKAILYTAPKAILYDAPKAILGKVASGINSMSGGMFGRLANTIMGSPSNADIASKLPTPKPKPGSTQDEEEILEKGRKNGLGR